VSKGEVKRWETISIDSRIHGTRLDVDDVPRITVLSASDHDRIVSELKAEVEYLKASRERLAQCELEALKRVEEKRQTIAKQAKVIEKLREQRDIELEDNCWDDASTGGRPFEQTRAMMEAEIEAINKLEDFKKV